jgi:hypothetical protein
MLVVNSDEGAKDGPVGKWLAERDNDLDSVSTTETFNVDPQTTGPGDCPLSPDPDTDRENSVLLPHRDIERWTQ